MWFIWKYGQELGAGAQLAISKRGGDGDQEDGGSGGPGAPLKFSK